MYAEGASLLVQHIAGVRPGLKALELRPDYDDAMAYMNLMYRERADIQCDDPAARQADLKAADDWLDKNMATRKAKAEKQPGAGGIVMDLLENGRIGFARGGEVRAVPNQRLPEPENLFGLGAVWIGVHPIRPFSAAVRRVMVSSTTLNRPPRAR